VNPADRLLEGWAGVPAMVLGPRLDVLAGNDLCRRLNHDHHGVGS
jgi:hypothetical protein